MFVSDRGTTPHYRNAGGGSDWENEVDTDTDCFSCLSSLENILSRRRSNSFSAGLPATPQPTPSSSYVSESILERQAVARLDLDTAAGQLLLTPDTVSPQSLQEEEKLEDVRQLCADLSLRSVSLSNKGKPRLF